MELVNKTIGQCLKETAAKYPDQTAIEYENWTCTWRELDEVTDLLAARMMKEYGIRQGSHVGIWSLNSPAFVQTVLAVYKLGAVVIVFNTANSASEMADQLKLSDTEVLFYGAGSRGVIFDEMIPRIREDVSEDLRFIHIDEREAGVWLTPASFPEEERSILPADKVRSITSGLDAQTAACIIFTSGTTSKPKAVVLTHFGIVNVNLRVQKCMHWTHNDKTVASVSMYHGFGLNTALTASVIVGMTMHVIPSFRTEDVWEAIDKYRCTVMLGVPSMYLALVRKPGNGKYDASSLTSGIIGGSVISTDEYREITSRFPGIHLNPSFGMTEASTSSSFSDWDEPLRSGQITGGMFIEDTMARIRDLASGEIVGWSNSASGIYGPGGKNTSGELELTGFCLFKEYYNMPEATRETMTDDGWLKTGDIAYFNDFDELCLTGRKKELIIRSGENISPREIEEAILQSGVTKQVKVVGVPSRLTQEEIAACIVAEEGTAIDAAALIAFLKQKLSYYKIPKYIFSFRELPMTASGKIKLGQLKETAAGLASDTESLKQINLSDNNRYYFSDMI
ncbi:MAG: acyl--CoA ligase [Firmicutes bacterium]|nr:acyl--CoA ligase [Bacillota bacterium]